MQKLYNQRYGMFKKQPGQLHYGLQIPPWNSILSQLYATEKKSLSTNNFKIEKLYLSSKKSGNTMKELAILAYNSPIRNAVVAQKMSY